MLLFGTVFIMDAWIEEEIAQELEKIGIDDIETVEEGEYYETSPFNLVWSDFSF